MKKRLNKILFLAFLIIFLINFVSANGYSDNTYIPNSVYCSDTDRGVYSTMKGTVTVSGKNYTDSCYTPDTIYEYYCSGATYGNSYIKCPLGYSCSSGVCVSVPVFEKLNISVATLKDTYKVGEAVELTDPPYDFEPSITGEAVSSDSTTIGKDLNDKTIVSTIRDKEGNVRYVDYSEDGTAAYTTSPDGRIIKERIVNNGEGDIISQEEAEFLKPNGYIVEFSEEPTIKTYTELRKKQESRGRIGKLFSPVNIKKSVQEKSLKIRDEHSRIKSVITQELNGALEGGNKATTITAKVIDESENNSWL